MSNKPLTPVGSLADFECAIAGCGEPACVIVLGLSLCADCYNAWCEIRYSVHFDIHAVWAILSEYVNGEWPDADGDIDIHTAIAAYQAGLLTRTLDQWDIDFAAQQGTREVTDEEWARRRREMYKWVEIEVDDEAWGQFPDKALEVAE